MTAEAGRREMGDEDQPAAVESAFARQRWAFFEALLAAAPPLTNRDIRIGILIWRLFNPEVGFAWPSKAYLANRAHCDERAVRRAVKKLVAEGWFYVNEGGGRGYANEYTPNWEKGGNSATL